MANFSGKLSYNDGNVAADSAPRLPPPAADCRQDPFVAASHNYNQTELLRQLESLKCRTRPGVKKCQAQGRVFCP